MATLASDVTTLADWVKTRDPDGKQAKIINMLGQKNEILHDLHVEEGNLPTGHRTTINTSLPSVGYRSYNEGAQMGKPTDRQVDFACAKLEAWSQVDKALADLQNDAAAFRLQKSSRFLEAMNQKAANDFFYGNADTDPKGFTGLAPWYSSSTSGDTNENVISGGGSQSDNTSIWLVVWGPNTIKGIFPKGSMAGLQHEDKGVQVARDASNQPYDVYMDKFVWDLGLAVEDWRYAVRIANIDVSNLTNNSSAADLIDLLIQAYHKIPDFGSGRAGIYCNRTVRTAIDRQARKDGKVYLDIETVQGKPQTKFWGIPFRTVDKITNAEAAI